MIERNKKVIVSAVLSTPLGKHVEIDLKACAARFWGQPALGNRFWPGATIQDHRDGETTLPHIPYAEPKDLPYTIICPDGRVLEISHADAAAVAFAAHRGLETAERAGASIVEAGATICRRLGWAR